MTSPNPALVKPNTLEPLPEFVPFSPPSIGDEEIREVVETLSSGWLATGPRAERFEADFKKYVGAEHAVAVNSCTAALHLALNALGVGETDGVITSPFTFASTGHVIMYQRARPFLVDIEPTTFNLDPERVREFLRNECTSGGEGGRPVHKETGRTIKALLSVHYGGHPCRMDELMSIAREYNLYVVEDAAHSVGAKYRGRPVGSIGDITCFSFYATKNLTTGEGGMVVTDQGELAERIRIMSMYGISDARRIWKRYAPKGSWVYDVADLGFKYNMMDIQAALGLHQLKKLDGFIARRRENAGIYRDILGPVPGVRLPITEDYAEHAWHLFTILLEVENLKIDRDEFIERLKELNVGTSVLFIPLHLHSYYQRELPYREGDFPVAEDVFKRIVNLPVSPALTTNQAKAVALTVAGLLEEAS